MKEISFDCTAEDRSRVRLIVERAAKDFTLSRSQRVDLEMDLVAAHANGCPMDLQKLLAAPDGTLSDRAFVVIEAFKSLWRKAHPAISEYWPELQAAAIKATLNPGLEVIARPWAYPASLPRPISGPRAKTRKLPNGQIEGLAAIYENGQLAAMASHVADNHNTARRRAEQALGIRRSK